MSPPVAVKKLWPGLMEAILDQLKKGRKAPKSSKVLQENKTESRVHPSGMG